MHATDDSADSSSTRPNVPGRPPAPPTAKERGGVQRAVDRLLDELAPERAAGRGVGPPVAVERHRTPRGCILQSATAAASVSWFADAVGDASFGELQLVVWRGVVSRPGSAHRVEGATVAWERVLRPVERSPGDWVWRAEDGSLHDTEALVAECLAMLEKQIGIEGTG